MDDTFSNISFKDSKVRNLLLIWFDFVESCDIVDYTVDPDCLDVGDMGRIDFIWDIIDVSFIDLLLSQNFSFKLFFISVRQFFNFIAFFVQQHLPINDLFFLRCQLFLELTCCLKSMKIGVLVHEAFLFRMDVKTNTFQGQVASDSVRKRQGKRWGANRWSQSSTEGVDYGRITGFSGAGFYKMSCHKVLSSFCQHWKILIFVERIQTSSEHFLLHGNRMFFVSTSWTFKFTMFLPLLIDSELFT